MIKNSAGATGLVTDHYIDAMKVRGTLMLRLDHEGRMVKGIDFAEPIKHLFTVSWWTEAQPPLRIHAHATIMQWNLRWDEYLADTESRRALALLTNGALPNELYQVENILSGMRREVPPNGGAIDGPFSLTTHSNIATEDQLQAALAKLTRTQLNLVLHSSFCRAINLSEYLPRSK